MATADLAALDRAQLVERVHELERQAEDFRLLMAQAPDGVFLADAAGCYVDVNEAGARMLGYAREEIIGKCIRDIVVPDDVVRLPGEIARFADGAVAISEWSFLRKDGSTFPGEMVGRRMPDGRLLDILRDITERRRALRALAESESFYRRSLESIPGLVFTTRPDGYCDYLNQQWMDYTGVPMPEPLGDGWVKLLHPDDRSRSHAAWRAAVEGRAPYDIEYRVCRHDGVFEWFHVIGRPIPDERGRTARWLGIAMNIERIKQAEAALARQRDTLVREVHHRIKNHLQGVLGLMRNAMVEQPEIAGAMESVVARIGVIAAVYGLQSQDLNQRVCLVDLMRSAAEGASGAAVPVECSLPAAGQRFLLAQEEAVPMALIMNELITNAVKHLAPPEPRRPVRALIKRVADGVRAEIRGGPAFLPAGFDFAGGRGIGTGLELLHSLLPPQGAALEFRQEADEVVAELRLTAPVILPLT